jgi:two-component system, NarL family, response regulator NreC
MTATLQLAQAPSHSRASSPPAGSPIKVVLADDHRLVRRSLRLLLESENDVEVIAEAGELFTALRHVKGHVPHVLLLDLRMPGGSSIQAIRRFRAEVPETEIVVLAMDDNPVFAQQAIDAGAVGYVLRDDADDEFSQAVRHAARGEAYVSQHIEARLDGLRRAVEIDGLSPRETEVLRLIALGLTSGEISDKLHLSRRTVDSHRRRIHRKLGLGKRSELVRYAIDRNLMGDRGNLD